MPHFPAIIDITRNRARISINTSAAIFKMAYNHPVHGATNTSYNAPLEQPAQPARPFGVDANGPATNQPGYNAPEGTHGQHVRFAGGTAPAGAGPAPGGASVPPPTTTGAAPGGGYGTGSGTSAGVAAPAATTATTSTTGPTAHENTGERAARSVKGVFAQAHVSLEPKCRTPTSR